VAAQEPILVAGVTAGAVLDSKPGPSVPVTGVSAPCAIGAPRVSHLIGTTRRHLHTPIG
jgi:hypothetical protein